MPRNLYDQNDNFYREGFPHGVAGSVSVDIGATAIALARYLSAVGVILLAAAVAINRERGESVLIGTAAATVLISFFALFHDLQLPNSDA